VQTVEVEKVVEVTPTPEAPKKYAGQSINFLAIQPHAVASTSLAKWFEEETGARVNVLIIPYGNVTEKATLDVTSGANEYDVLEYWYPSLGVLVENGVLTDITDWWNANAEALQFDDFVPAFADTMTLIDGKRYGLPNDGDLHLLWYNKAILDKYNLQAPATWDDYYAACKTITDAEKANGIYGCGIMASKIPLILIGTYLNRLATFGGSFFTEDGKPNINSPEAVAALEELVRELPIALPDPTAVAFDELLGPWLTGRVAMAEFWTDLGQMSNNPEQSTIIGQAHVAPMPQGPAPNGRVAAPMNAGFGLGVSTGAQNPEVAMAFLEFVAQPATNVRANTIVGGLDPTRLSTYDNPDYRAFVGDELADAAKSAVLSAAVPWPTDAKWAELQEVLNENLALALTGDKTPKEALDDTQAEWEAILAQ
jgi:multiple sugar transport system substrate-binding protein